MLVQLTIKRIALIDELVVEFAPGLLVLTGETGAGKSIVIGAVSFLLGDKSDRDLLQTGAARGSVEALFDVGGQPQVQQLLQRLELETDENLLSVTRELSASGRTVCRIAGVVVPLATLRELTALLVDLHGQHAHQALLDSKRHQDFLDGFGREDHKQLLETLRVQYRSWHETRGALAKAKTELHERARRLDMLQFQLQELDEAKLLPDEEIALEAQHNRARYAEKISGALNKACILLQGGERSRGAVDGLRQALSFIEGIADLESSYAAIQERMAEIFYPLEDLAADLDTLRDECEMDPEQINRVEERLDLISRLRRKYGTTTREMLAYREEVAQQLEQALEDDTLVERLEKRLKEEEKAYIATAQQLSNARRALAESFTARMLEQLSQLGMGSAQFAVDITQANTYTEEGIDRTEFLISPNPGEPLRPLARIASGGETSRLMLAIKSIAADQAGVPVVIFDEIDTGISGRMAQVVAEKMADIGHTRQVICVTHLPQIAAMADASYRVAKSTDGTQTRTHLQLLDNQGHIAELARMLGGANPESESSLRHAASLLEDARQWKARAINKN